MDAMRHTPRILPMAIVAAAALDVAFSDKDPRRGEPVRLKGKTGRNDPCPCGSGKKYKRCHRGKVE